ncbi:MAG: DEAD/DEAH box helicase [Oscillospiraceae bacterium]|nr:DEAD/DEAH box helicase [Oscillospiraceae bacterium]
MALKRDRQQIRDILALIEQFDADVAEIASQEALQQAAAAEAMGRLGEKELSGVLRGMDVENINREKLGLRVAALRAAGIENMEQLCALSADDINAVKGIGDEAAWLIYTMAGRIRRESETGLKLRVSLDDRNEDATKLLLTAKTAMETDAAVREAQALYREYHDSLAAAYLDAKPAAGSVGWLFLPKEKKQRALDAALYLYELLTGEYGERVRALNRAYDSRRIPDEAGVWEDFRNNSAAYYARLDSFARALNTRIDNSYSGLPEELVREVEMEPIHTEKLHAALRAYQEFGVRYILRQGKVLLGDEMGLGKTVQAIAAMVSLHERGATHFMVVCPASVLVNWCREIQSFSELAATAIRGGDRAALMRWLERGGIAVTTYESISRFTLPEDFRFSMIVADEAHYVKNPATRRTQALLLLRRRAERVLFMTGTPLENRVDEMCFLVSCLRPEIGGELREMKYISSAPQFREKLAPVYLRRTREDVLQELPELIEKEQWCELGPEERRMYLLAVSAENFMAMRQVSWDVGDLKHSSKARRLFELCQEAEEDGRKVIVFSYFRETIRAVCQLLGKRALEPITGTVSPQRRQQLVDAFTAAEAGKVLVCQVQAGGTGLNIQSASVIIFCEPQIKPSVEKQAISRAYRMGQLRSVLVYRLLCDNTVDERILELLREKQELFDTFAAESTAGSEYMKAEQSMSAAIIQMEKERLAAELPPAEEKT